MIEVGKLYLTKAHTSQQIGQTARVELRGTVSLTVYGSEGEADDITGSTDMTPASGALTEDFYYPFDTLPKYIAFVGTSDLIDVSGYDLTYIKDLV